MMFKLKYVLSLLLLFLSIRVMTAQEKAAAGYFQSPLELPLYLSGTFGEPRTGHFHTGIDIKTNGAEGAKIFAVADGYVSRIKISAFGYGKALYITHPNGYVSVYGHLSGFNKEIGDYVKKEHYRLESFEMDIYPEKDRLAVAKGELVAFSGNSGSSGGPHLHFEIRREDAQKPVNPLLNGFHVKDGIPPRISLVRIYPVDGNSLVNGKNEPVSLAVEGTDGNYRLAEARPVSLRGRIAFGLALYDQQDGTSNKNGAYSLQALLDSRPFFGYTFDQLSFDEGRYVNSLIDYPEYIDNKLRIQRTLVDPNNKLSVYKDLDSQGVVTFSDSLSHVIRFEVEDAQGNRSVLEIETEPGPESPAVEYSVGPVSGGDRTFHYNGLNRFAIEKVVFESPVNAFYDSFEFNYSELPALKNTYSSLHRIHDRHTPVHLYCSLSIMPEGLPERLFDKALIARIDNDGNRVSAGGELKDGFVTAQVREFGNYCIVVDTVAPDVIPVRPGDHRNLRGVKTLRIIIKDDLSGIRSYRATLNDRWILMEYDAKKDVLIYTIDDKLREGENPMVLEVVDMKGNTAIYKTILSP